MIEVETHKGIEKVHLFWEGSGNPADKHNCIAMNIIYKDGKNVVIELANRAYDKINVLRLGLE